MNRHTKQMLVQIAVLEEKYGCVVYDYDGNQYDWGQALARERYGPDWKTIDYPEDPDEDDVLNAIRWRDGKWPEWIAAASSGGPNR